MSASAQHSMSWPSRQSRASSRGRASADGLTLKPWKGADLNVGHELDKLASNIALGRDFGGVQSRSDGIERLKLGEEVAIRLLRDQSRMFNEGPTPFTFNRFDGTPVTI